MFVLRRPLKLDLFLLFNDFSYLTMMEAVLTLSFASSSSAAQLHEFTFIDKKDFCYIEKK